MKGYTRFFFAEVVVPLLLSYTITRRHKQDLTQGDFLKKRKNPSLGEGLKGKGGVASRSGLSSTAERTKIGVGSDLSSAVNTELHASLHGLLRNSIGNGIWKVIRNVIRNELLGEPSLNAFQNVAGILLVFTPVNDLRWQTALGMYVNTRHIGGKRGEGNGDLFSPGGKRYPVVEAKPDTGGRRVFGFELYVQFGTKGTVSQNGKDLIHRCAKIEGFEKACCHNTEFLCD